jgi:hypothetical protein
VKKILKWTITAVLALVLVGMGGFLYAIPPFFIAAPETFSKPLADAAPRVDHIKAPAERLIAERGRYLVTTGLCIGCHGTPTPQGPDLARYLAGGMRFQTSRGTFVARNLTPDAETGIGKRSDEELMRVLRSGVFPDGHVRSYRLMPWGAFSNYTEEDRYAIVVYLRNLPPVRHRIPDPDPSGELADEGGAFEAVYGGRDYALD